VIYRSIQLCHRYYHIICSQISRCIINIHVLIVYLSTSQYLYGSQELYRSFITSISISPSIHFIVSPHHKDVVCNHKNNPITQSSHHSSKSVICTTVPFLPIMHLIILMEYIIITISSRLKTNVYLRSLSLLHQLCPTRRIGFHLYVHQLAMKLLHTIFSLSSITQYSLPPPIGSIILWFDCYPVYTSKYFIILNYIFHHRMASNHRHKYTLSYHPVASLSLCMLFLSLSSLIISSSLMDCIQ